MQINGAKEVVHQLFLWMPVECSSCDPFNKNLCPFIEIAFLSQLVPKSIYRLINKGEVNRYIKEFGTRSAKNLLNRQGLQPHPKKMLEFR